jgi:hypothetical protein
VYTSPIRVTADQTIKDVAVEAAGNKSPVATFAYSVGTTASPAANPVPHAFPAGTPVVNTAPQLYDITIFPERDFVVADGYEPNTHLNKKVIIAATAEAAYPDPNENGKLIVKGTAMGEDGNRLPIERLGQRIINPAFTATEVDRRDISVTSPDARSPRVRGPRWPTTIPRTIRTTATGRPPTRG